MNFILHVVKVIEQLILAIPLRLFMKHFRDTEAIES